MPNNDETRINFDKIVPLRDKTGNLIGEALVTMRNGNIVISAEIMPHSVLGQELMRCEGPMVLGFKGEEPTTEIDYSVFEQ